MPEGVRRRGRAQASRYRRRRRSEGEFGKAISWAQYTLFRLGGFELADRHAIIEKGQVVWTGTSAALAAEPTIAQRYLQV